MKLTPLMVYLWGIADNIQVASTIFVFVLTPVSFLLWGFATIDEAPEFRKPAKWCTGVSILVLLVYLFTPSSKTIAIMYVAPALANSEAIQKDVPELWKAGVDALKAKFKEGEKDK